MSATRLKISVLAAVIIVGLGIIHWTIRLALVAYAVHLLAEHYPACDCVLRRRVSRAGWQLGGLLLFLHTVAAMTFYHHGSFAHAVADTAAKTQAVLGWSFGNGIWFSFLLVAVWMFDIVRAWFRPAPAADSFKTEVNAVRNTANLAESPKLLRYYAGFILFNGAIVFEQGITRPLGIIVCLFLATMLISKKFRRTTDARNRNSPTT